MRTKLLFISVFCFLSGFAQNAKSYVIIFYCNNIAIKKGYVHFLSNDVQVNEVSFFELLQQEKNDFYKVNNSGIYKVSKTYINEKFNKSNADTIRGFIRCDNSLGIDFNFHRKEDSIRVYLYDTLKLYSCFW